MVARGGRARAVHPFERLEARAARPGSSSKREAFEAVEEEVGGSSKRSETLDQKSKGKARFGQSGDAMAVFEGLLATSGSWRTQERYDGERTR